VVIKSFNDDDTERLFRNERLKRWRSIETVARRKLVMMDAAEQLTDLRVPPGNRLPSLKQDREGQHAIRINDQYRICFIWRDGNAYDVEITDYH
jgi:proteic killer suppression protein